MRICINYEWLELLNIACYGRLLATYICLIYKQQLLHDAIVFAYPLAFLSTSYDSNPNICGFQGPLSLLSKYYTIHLTQFCMFSFSILVCWEFLSKLNWFFPKFLTSCFSNLSGHHLAYSFRMFFSSCICN